MSKILRVSVRPGVEKVFVSAARCASGTLLAFRGTQADLLTAGVAQPYMFENMPKSGRRVSSDEFGDQYYLDRHANGVWELSVRHHEEPFYDDVCNCADKVRKQKWWQEAKANVDPVVEDIIARATSPLRPGGRTRTAK